jgi:hypothetical protein
METFEITERITKESIKIQALSWKIEDYQHTFYCVDEMGTKIVMRSYTTRFWDLTDRYKKDDK